MDNAKAGQLGKSGADVKDGLLAALHIDLQLIGGIARALDPDNPGLADKFPAASNSADSIVSMAERLPRRAGDQASFVADLRTDRDAVGSGAHGAGN
jgi:hypothetical protein